MAEGAEGESGSVLVSRASVKTFKPICSWTARCSYVPALAVGFDDLQKRVEAQRQQSEAHQQKLKVCVL